VSNELLEAAKAELRVTLAHVHLKKENTMTNEQLAALSEAATQGEWTYCRNPENTRWIIDSASAHAIACGAGYEPVNGANAAFIVALVNAYRTGKLVLIGDDAVERMARAIDPEIWACDPPISTLAAAIRFHERRRASCRIATAALAALTGEDA
jgi:hypothetical protein